MQCHPSTPHAFAHPHSSTLPSLPSPTGTPALALHRRAQRAAAPRPMALRQLQHLLGSFRQAPELQQPQAAVRSSAGVEQSRTAALGDVSHRLHRKSNTTACLHRNHQAEVSGEGERGGADRAYSRRAQRPWGRRLQLAPLGRHLGTLAHENGPEVAGAGVEEGADRHMMRWCRMSSGPA